MRQYLLAGILLAFLCQTAIGQSIRATTSMAGKRIFHQSQPLPGNKVLVFGGQTTGTNFQPITHTSCEIYDPATETWSSAAPMQRARRNHASVVTQNGAILAIGGDSNTVNQLTVERYDPQANSWTLVGQLNQARLKGDAIVLDNGTVLVVGHHASTFETGPPDGSGLWTQHGMPNILMPSEPRVIRMNDTRILVAGSHPALMTNPGVLITQSLTVDTTKNRMPANRPGAGLALLSNGKVLVTGGNASGSNDLFDPSSDLFSPAGIFNNSHLQSPLMTMADGRVAVVDMGVTGSDQEILEIYNSATNSWQVILGHHFYATGHYCVTPIGNGKHLITGGSEFMQLTTTGSSKAFIFDESGNTTTLTDNRKLQLAGFYVPIAHEIHLKSNSEFHFPYTTLLYDINGKRHGTFIISERNPTIKLPPLPPGIYLVYVVEKVTNATGTIKFIIP